MNGPAKQTQLSLAQVALNSADLSASLRLYCELFGFANAGGSAVWGKVLDMQELPPDAHCIVWWLVGPAPFFQMEFFHHGSPKQRPQPEDWRPCDHGWVRLGIAVSDFDRVVSGLERYSVKTLGKAGERSHRRLAFRDPYVGNIVEVIEDGADASPSLAYVTSSVADPEGAHAFYRDVVGAEIRPLDTLHTSEDEALWGLAGAEREGFLACLPGGILEIVHYISPAGRPRRADHLTSDQGIMNIAIGSRSSQDIRDLIDRVHKSGHKTTTIVDSGPVCGTYITESGYEMELMGIPEELDSYLGFVTGNAFVTEFEG